MLARIQSIALKGLDPHRITVEVDARLGKHKMVVVGMGDTAVQEAKERVKVIKNSSYEYWFSWLTINLAPSDLRKEGSSFDVPIALGVLIASKQFSVSPGRNLETIYALGELSLTGDVQHIPGILPMVSGAKELGATTVIVPYEDHAEASLIGGITIVGVRSLREAVGYLSGAWRPKQQSQKMVSSPEILPEVDLADIKGQAQAKRVLEICAAGGHTVLFRGPPGSGKTMLAKALAGLLPPMHEQESLAVSKVYSIAGLLSKEHPMVTTRPFRAPHHTASYVSLVGGGHGPRPGEVSLAHHGVLFLDELSEFRQGALEVLREPLEEGSVTIARAHLTVRFPARFTLVAAMNPCPCGYATDTEHACRCTPLTLMRYQQKLSGPLLDRIDMHLEVPRVPVEELQKHFFETAHALAPIPDQKARVTSAKMRNERQGAGTRSAKMRNERQGAGTRSAKMRHEGHGTGTRSAKMRRVGDGAESSESPRTKAGTVPETSAVVRERIIQAREIQSGRLGISQTNSMLTARGIAKFCAVDEQTEQFLASVVRKFHLSARGYHRTLKVARTIADLEGESHIGLSHVSEAVQYRVRS